MSNWPEVLRLLKAAGYTQEQIADECDCAQSVISDIAKGKNTDPRVSIADGIRRLEAKAKRKLARQPEGA